MFAHFRSRVYNIQEIRNKGLITMDALVIENLRKTYSNGRGIKEINLNVQKGKIHALLGNNGAGKSTTMKCITGIIFPEGGRIEVMGDELRDNDPKVKSCIGYSPELPSFPRNLTGRQCLVVYGYLKGLSKNQIRLESRDLLEKVGLIDASEIKVSQYSRGMLQRLDLAIAMEGSPDVLILDEPTAGLDPSSASKLRILLKEQAEEGQTILLSDHQLSEVERLCSDATIINEGRTVIQSKMSDLLKKVKGKLKYIAEFSSISDGLIRGIEKIDDIVGVEVDHSNRNALIIYCNTRNQLDDEVSRVAKAEGCSLYSLAESRATLEDIFLSLVDNGE